VYWWGQFSLALSESYDDATLGDVAAADDYSHHGSNMVANSFNAEYQKDNFPDELIMDAIKSEGVFARATPIQRRIVTETSLATIVLHMYAIDKMYKSVDVCNTGVTDPDNWWDRGVASLIGWSEGTEDGGSEDSGTLFYDISQYVCAWYETCVADGDAKVNKMLMSSLKEGKQSLTDLDCGTAEAKLNEAELYLQVST
jgi:hypothetical protein